MHKQENIPPLNANTNFKLHAELLQPHHIKNTKVNNDVPDNYSWSIINNWDNNIRKEKKTRMHRVNNQGRCGSCWAESVSSTLSDCLVAAGAVSHRPDISVTQCLICYPQGQCNGGSPSKLATDIIKNGIMDETCIDYSWCDNNPDCNGKAPTHFDAANQSDNLPQNCGCVSMGKKFLYKIDPESVKVLTLANWNHEKLLSIAKMHILNYGPLIGGYAVYNNFKSGFFTKSSHGIYLEDVDYDSMTDPNKPIFRRGMTSQENLAGFHAVAIMGWGIEHDVEYSPGVFATVPYWHVRNSWGSDWGDHGFFKMGMYPFNKKSQFENEVQGGVAGSICMFTATKPPSIVDAQKLPAQDLSKIDLENPKDFYLQSPTEFAGKTTNDPPETMKENYLYIAGSMVLIFIIAVMLYKKK